MNPEHFENEESYLDKVESNLYSRNRKSFYDMRSDLSVNKNEKTKKFSWEKEGVDSDNFSKIKESNILKPVSKKFFSTSIFFVLFFSITLFLSSLSYAFYNVYFGNLSVKQNEIELSMDLPSFTNSGQNLIGRILIQNKNKIDLSAVGFSVDIKDKQTENITNLLQISVGNIKSGQDFSKNLDIALQGAAGSVKEVSTTIFYKVEGSDSVFQKNIKQEIEIKKTEATINITGPKIVSVGQTSEFRINVRGQSDISTNMSIKLDLPKNIKILESSIDPISKNLYNIGELTEGKEKVLILKTIFEDQKELIDSFALKASVGSTGEGDLKNVFSENSISISLKDNSFSISVESEKQSGDSIYFLDKKPKIKLSITNKSKDTIKNGVLTARLSGGLFNPKSLSVTGAQYDAGSGIIKATAETNNELKEIAPGGVVSFEITLQDTVQSNINSSRKISIDTIFSADVSDTLNSPATIKKLVNLFPKDNAVATLKTLYFSGPYKNIGAVPPKIGIKNSYTLSADIETYSGFKNGFYTIILPEYVEYIKSDSGDVTYNKSKREISWKVGEIKALDSELATAIKKEIFVQVNIIPTPDQKRLSPKLTRGVKFEALSVDGKSIKTNIADVDIIFSKDPKYESSKGYGEVGE